MKRWRIALATAVIAAVPLAVVAGQAAQAAPACRVDYTVGNQWQGGFQGGIVVRNLGDPVTSWNLTFSFAQGQKITQGWGGAFSQSGANVTVKNETWNGSLGTNASANPGFLASWSGSNPIPTSFALNGTTCTGAPVVTTPPEPTGPSTTMPPPSSTTPPPPSSTTPPPSSSTTPPPPSSTTPPPTGAAPALKVSGNTFVTSAGATYRLLGVNRSGGEFACIQGNGMWNGPMDQASITAMRNWKVRTVRVPLNEECWLGTPDVPAGAPSGATYQQNVKDYVNLLISNGITPIVEMHWNYGQYTGPSSGCTDVKATCQKPMPDAQYAPNFWTGVANAFKGNNAVIFDLFNEPYPERATGDATSGWKCWRDGGTCAGIPYQVAGFQSLVTTVRATGATNVIMIGGLAYSNDLTQWLTYKPTDPLNNLAAFAHIYNFNTCSNVSCYDSQLAPVAAQVPLTLSEIGENDCAHGFVDTLMNWADTKKIGYLGWTWNNWDCSSGPSLITDWDGTATAYGLGLKAKLNAISN